MVDLRKSTLRRTLWSLFFAFVATGMSFYVILFCTLMLYTLTHPLNPASTPGLQAHLREVVLPISVAAGVVVFLLVFLRSGKARHEKKGSNKAAA